MNLFFDKILNPLRGSISKYSSRPAFFIQEECFTYKQLSERISAIRRAVHISEFAEKIWGLAIHDDLDTYASIFALWMEGKAYVPLHPNQPIDRNVNIMEQVGTGCVLDSSSDSHFGMYNVIHTGSLTYTSEFLDDWADADPNSLAYILFTSGSTGTPKGVMLSRENIGSFMDSFWKTGIEINETDRCLQCFDLTFDVSVQSYLVALTKGACVYTVPYGQVKYLHVASLIDEQHITFGAMAPSMLTYLKPYMEELDFSSLKACIMTAEACPVALMEELYKYADNVDIYDFYGPTEATIYCTSYKLSRDKENLSLNGIISIGKPLANVETIIIDEQYNELPRGEKGELCVAGSQVTQGYWNNPEKNESSFFTKDYNGEKMRFYHTGDLCYMREDGNIMYSGRIDQQAKIQGFRVELGEIEHHAREFFKREKRAVAVAFQNESDLTEIALFIESEEMDVKELIVFFRSKMPSYMIPTRILFKKEFPLNNNDKIDRNKLKQNLK